MDKQRTIMPYGRYTDDELELFKQVFAENLPLIKIVRKVMLQLPISEAEELQWRKTFYNNKSLNDLMRKMFLPTLDGDAPINQVVDLWLTVNLENKLPDEVISLINSRAMVIKYLDLQLRVLSNEIEKSNYNFNWNSFDTNNADELKARNTIIMHVEHQLNEIKGLAGFKKETAEETIKRLQANSNK